MWDGKPLRVYALFAQPEGQGPFPAILQIHGGGQTCSPENVAYFVKHGYACLSYDWTGDWSGVKRPPEEITDWGPEITQNYFGSAGQDPRRIVVYHATLAAIRGLDVLCAQQVVDTSRLGIQGISWGGLITWLVNALDPRARTVVPVYGVGDVIEHDSGIGEGLRAQMKDWARMWRENFDPASYGKRQHASVMFLDGADDYWGPLLLAERRLGELTVEHRRSYSPNRMHSLSPESVAAGMAWFDAQLKGNGVFPKEPLLTLGTSRTGVPQARVRVDSPTRVTRVQVHYSRGPEPPLTRCWLTNGAQPISSKGRWETEIPIVNPNDQLMAIAQVTYEGGFSM